MRTTRKGNIAVIAALLRCECVPGCTLSMKKETIMYSKVDTNMNFVDREKATELFWKEIRIF